MGDFRFSLRHGTGIPLDPDQVKEYEPFVYKVYTAWLLGVKIPNNNYLDDVPNSDYDSQGHYKYSFYYTPLSEASPNPWEQNNS